MAGQVDVEVAPSLLEVGIEVGLEGRARETLVGVEDLLSSSISSGLVHPEVSTGLAVDLFSSLRVLVAVTFLDSVVLDHGAHEDVIGVSREARSGDAAVAVTSLVSVMLEESVPLAELDVLIVSGNIILSLDIPDIAPELRCVRLGLSLGLGISVSAVGLGITESTDHILVVIVPVDGSELPDLMGILLSGILNVDATLLSLEEGISAHVVAN